MVYASFHLKLESVGLMVSNRTRAHECFIFPPTDKEINMPVAVEIEPVSPCASVASLNPVYRQNIWESRKMAGRHPDVQK
jgi:hypothetical protein